MTRTQRQIEDHRTGAACVPVCDHFGHPWVGVPVWAEQETHAFAFGCVAPERGGLSECDWQRCRARLDEVFNRFVSADQPSDVAASRVEVPAGVRLGRFRLDLDRLAAAGQPLEVHVRGRAVGLGTGTDERTAAERAAELYTLCFAHSAVWGIVWNGFWDGEEGTAGGGLLRLDFAPKPAFRFLHKLIGTVWHSRASGATDADGRFRFRGFFGDYRVVARLGDEAATTTLFSLR